MTTIRALSRSSRDQGTRPLFMENAATSQYNQKAPHPTAELPLTEDIHPAVRDMRTARIADRDRRDRLRSDAGLRQTYQPRTAPEVRATGRSSRQASLSGKPDVWPWAPLRGTRQHAYIELGHLGHRVGTAHDRHSGCPYRSARGRKVRDELGLRSAAGDERDDICSFRLNPDEVTALQSVAGAAGAAGVPGSTLARSWIVERIQEEQASLSDAEAELRATPRRLTHLQRHLRQQAS